jgi:hypothetical protein
VTIRLPSVKVAFHAPHRAPEMSSEPERAAEPGSADRDRGGHHNENNIAHLPGHAVLPSQKSSWNHNWRMSLLANRWPLRRDMR